jgi:cytochrome d ubiquinol oxidase subunit I
MMADPLLLARLQFAANISFHILFPTISISLGWLLLFFRLRHARTGDAKWGEAYQFWVKVFALTFALGVVSGITMSFQFGTNWPGYMKTVGNVAGPLLAYEVLTAFFLEATFLGIMLFGAQRVSQRLLNLSTFMVAFGTTLSAFWIIALNSWMHTPAGYRIVDGVVHAADWLAILFNPSMPYRLTHMLLASGLTTAFLVAGVSAYRWLRHDRSAAVMVALKSAVAVAACLIPMQIVVGDMHGLNTLQHQPAKIAAMEAVWDTERGAPLLLFALPDAKRQTNDYAVSVPRAASLILTHDANGEVRGIKSFGDQHPPVAPLFWGFRIMVGTGMLMLASSWLAAFTLRRRGDLTPMVARLLVAMSFAGWLATLAGWYVTEIGRQPWLVYGVLTTAQAAADHPPALVASSLVMYLVLYAALAASYVSVIFLLARKAGKGALPPEAGGAALADPHFKREGAAA